jgi:hypothetical protein
MRERENGDLLLGMVVRDMIRGGVFDGIEIGFCRVINNELLGRRQ